MSEGPEPKRGKCLINCIIFFLSLTVCGLVISLFSNFADKAELNVQDNAVVESTQPQAPTDILEPTFTPLPTHTPKPTQTALPTQTATPTLSPEEKQEQAFNDDFAAITHDYRFGSITLNEALKQLEYAPARRFTESWHVELAVALDWFRDGNQGVAQLPASPPRLREVHEEIIFAAEDYQLGIDLFDDWYKNQSSDSLLTRAVDAMEAGIFHNKAAIELFELCRDWDICAE